MDDLQIKYLMHGFCHFIFIHIDWYNVYATLSVRLIRVFIIR